MAPKEVDRQLLLNYLEAHCSRDQLLQIREYLHDEAYRDSLNRFMEEEWEALNRQQFPPLPDMDDQYKKFNAAYVTLRKEAAMAPRKGGAMTPGNGTPVRVIRRTAAIAAALLLAAVGVWLLLPRLAGRPAQGVVTQWLSWHNGSGHPSEILLPDSTRVYLGPAGTLRYGQNDDRSRLLQLEGEAYFIVRHDQRRPFTVVTGALVTRDIGTEFNIRYFPGEPTIAIAVASGKVQVAVTSGADTPGAAASRAADVSLALLTPGQLLQYDSLTQRSGIMDLSDVSLIGAWRKGILSFHRQRLKEVTDELQRYYGVAIQYADPAAKEILITTLLDNKSFEEALDIVSITAGVHFTRERGRILVK